MTDVHAFLAHIWFFLSGLMLVLYVVLDGFDLGIGILTLFACRDEGRGEMMASVGQVWDANETWLVLLGGALFGAFPVVYATVFHALYIPVSAMLFGLIFRGVAFEFREHAQNKIHWSIAFGIGSLLAALAQGFTLGAVIRGIPVQNGHFVGGIWDWFGPFPIVVAIGVAAGFSLLGATYLIIKTEGRVQARSYRYAWASGAIMIAAATAVTIWTPLLHPRVLEKWFTLPMFFYLAPLPGFAVFSFLMLIRALMRHYEHAPFFWSLAIFLASFSGLAATLYPYILPPDITAAAGASSDKTLVFMLTGIGMLIPVMLIYNGYQYVVFRGKVRGEGYGGE